MPTLEQWQEIYARADKAEEEYLEQRLAAFKAKQRASSQAGTGTATTSAGEKPQG